MWAGLIRTLCVSSRKDAFPFTAGRAATSPAVIIGATAWAPSNGALLRTNLAWGQPEPNTFGTDEFVALCRATGSEPMICVNAGNGTPEEAAQWVEYCNSAATTPLGKLRAATATRSRTT